jgi:hypothetical protein
MSETISVRVYMNEARTSWEDTPVEVFLLDGHPVINTTYQPLHFCVPVGTGAPARVVVLPSGIALTASKRDIEMLNHAPVPLLKTVYKTDASSLDIIQQLYDALQERGLNGILIGTEITARAYPGKVFAPISLGRPGVPSVLQLHEAWRFQTFE